MKNVVIAVLAGVLATLLVTKQPAAARKDASLELVCRKVKKLEKTLPSEQQGSEAMHDLKKAMLLFQAEVIKFNNRDPQNRLNDATFDLIERHNTLIRLTARAQSVVMALEAFCE